MEDGGNTKPVFLQIQFIDSIQNIERINIAVELECGIVSKNGRQTWAA